MRTRRDDIVIDVTLILGKVDVPPGTLIYLYTIGDGVLVIFFSNEMKNIKVTL